MIPFNSSFNETLPFSDTCAQINLAANVEQTFTVPGNATQKFKAIFSYASNANVYVSLNVTATTPGAGLQTSTANLEYKPDTRYVSGGDVLHAISGDAAGANVGIALWLLPG